MSDRWVPGRVLGPQSPAPPQPPRPAEGRRDDWFEGIELRASTEAALSAASGCEHVDVRITNSDGTYGSARDAVESGHTTWSDRGIGVRVLRDGRWGFAAGPGTSPRDAAVVAQRAVAMARVSGALGRRGTQLAPEPAHTGWWSSPHEVDPLEVRSDERMALLTSRSARLLADPAISHTRADYFAVRERVHYADSAGTFVQQQRIRVQAEWTGVTLP